MSIFFDYKILQNLPKRVKVVVGIPSYNNAETISFVSETAAEGIFEYFGSDGLIVNADGGSKDGTKEVFMKTETKNVPKIAYDYIGLPGKGSAMLSVIELGLCYALLCEAQIRRYNHKPSMLSFGYFFVWSSCKTTNRGRFWGR